MLALNPLLQQELLDITSLDTIATGALVRACAGTKADVLARCAGLVVHYKAAYPEQYQPRYGQENVELAEFLRSTFRFIHRTAQDFLCHTDSGRKILDYNKRSTGAILLAYIQSNLAMCRLFRLDCWECSPDLVARGMVSSRPTNIIGDLSTQVHWILAYRELASDNEVSQNLLPTVRLLEKNFQRGLSRPQTDVIVQSIQFYGCDLESLVRYQRTVMRDDAFVLEVSRRCQYNARLWRLMPLLLDDNHLRTTTLSQVLGYTCNSRRSTSLSLV